MKLLNFFTKHPHSVDESYFGHLFRAVTVSLRLFLGGVICLIHAIFPFVFINTGSKLISDLHAEITEIKSKANPSN